VADKLTENSEPSDRSESRLTLVEIGDLSPGLLVGLRGFLEEATGVPCDVAPEALEPRPAYVASRGQYDTRPLLAQLRAFSTQPRHRVLGSCDVDIFSAVFTFVFGEAEMGGQAGIFSLHRLRPKFYGLSDDPELVAARMRKEALHESGHLFGLAHCRNPECVMRFSAAAEEIDLKRDRFCPECAQAVRVTPS
jgi:archaemetzincin